MGNLKNREATQFSSTNQPRNRGRKPKKLKRFSEKFDVSEEELRDLFKVLLFDKNADELRDFLQNENKNDKLNDVPAVVSLCAEILLKEAEKGKSDFLIEILDRVYGKQKNIVEIQSPVDYEERKRVLAALLARDAEIDGRA